MPSHSASVCVFCASRPGRDPAALTSARATGEMLARNNWRLVYGAGDRGLMGAVAEGCKSGNGATLGVIPTHLIPREREGRPTAPDHIVTETMHERKRVMYANSQALVILPGGAGTLDEFFEVVTWKQIGLHEKPVFLVDAGGFWQPLIALIENLIEQGFAEASLRTLFTVVPDVAALEDALHTALS